MSARGDHAEAQLFFPGLIDADDGWVWADDEERMEYQYQHATVMCDELVQTVLAGRTSGLYVDATLGGGGHSERLLELAPNARILAFDRDINALEASRHRLEKYRDRIEMVHEPFSSIAAVLKARGIEHVDGLFADLGVSSPQLDVADRGMSFRLEGPLDMRMDTSRGETARELIRRVTDEALADLIFQYGDEHRSRRIARSIKRALFEKKLETTLDLRKAVIRAVGPARVGGVDPATKTFQAIRISVNDELGEVERLLAALPTILSPDGIVGILSFHSLEDRLVKRAFADKLNFELVTKKPVTASTREVEQNARSRSAKLRAVRKVIAGAVDPSAMNSGAVNAEVGRADELGLMRNWRNKAREGERAETESRTHRFTRRSKGPNEKSTQEKPLRDKRARREEGVVDAGEEESDD